MSHDGRSRWEALIVRCRILLQKKSRLLGCSILVAGVVENSTHGAIPEAAFMKTNAALDSTKYVFKTSVILDPTLYNGDASTGLQKAVDAIANANLTKGGVIFLKPGNYTLTKSVKISGSGIVIVGVRDVVAPGVWGAYPTLRYGNDFVDPDYDPASTNAAQQQPAVIRINGNADYSKNSAYSYNGLHGLNLECTATGNSPGAIATAITAHMPHLNMCRDISITNAFNGVNLIDATTPSLHNISITGLRGDFGIRCGDPDSDAVKVQGLRVTAAPGNTNATLAYIPGNTEFVGADLQGGKIGIDINGWGYTNWAGDVFIRSVHIQGTAEQGIRVGYAAQVYITDLAIDNAGREALRITTNFYGGLTLANFTATASGFSALRVDRGMNISVVNARLLDSGQHRAIALSGDLPIAGLWIDSSVTSFNLAGALIGSNGQAHEDWGVYVNPNAPAYAPWHAQTLIAQNIDWLLDRVHFSVPLHELVLGQG